MKASVTIGLIHNLMWINWAIRHCKRKYAWKIIMNVVSLSFAMSLELLDFPAIFRIFDAHSLWHLATIPITSLYWDFIYDDAFYELEALKAK
jgi:hypothetical protein